MRPRLGLISILVAKISAVACCSDELVAQIQKCFGPSFNPNDKYVIAIQGASASGKTTLTQKLKEVLEGSSNENIRAMAISTDSFYKTLGHSPNKHKDYDFDNPAAIDWEAMAQCFKSYISNDDHSVESTYDFTTKVRTERTVENPRPNVIIVEGIFAHNLFNDEIFNDAEYDPHNSLTEVPVKVPFIENNFPFDRSRLKVLRIFLKIDRATMLRTRIHVDKVRANRTEEEVKERFEKFIFPATMKWVNITDITKPDIILSQGTRDAASCTRAFNALVRYFDVDIEDDFLTKYLNNLRDSSPETCGSDSTQ